MMLTCDWTGLVWFDSAYPGRLVGETDEMLRARIRRLCEAPARRNAVGNAVVAGGADAEASAIMAAEYMQAWLAEVGAGVRR